MVLPLKYQTQPSAIASYDYTDVADGTGNSTFYLCYTADNSGDTLILTNEILYSTEIDYTYQIDAADNTDAANLDFNLTAFNTPRTIQGNATVEIGMSLYQSTTADDRVWTYNTINLYKVSGGVETLIGTAVSATEANPGSDTSTYYINTFSIPLTQTHFKIGDNLRANILVHVSGAGTAGCGSVTIGHDPQNRDNTILPSSEDVITSSRVIVPFRIDL